MAKTVKGFEEDDHGNRVEYSHKLTRHQRKSESQLIGWSEGPGTSRWKKFKRAAIG